MPFEECRSCNRGVRARDERSISIFGTISLSTLPHVLGIILVTVACAISQEALSHCFGPISLLAEASCVSECQADLEWTVISILTCSLSRPEGLAVDVAVSHGSTCLTWKNNEPFLTGAFAAVSCKLTDLGSSKAEQKVLSSRAQ